MPCVGKDSPNHDGVVKSWWNDPQADNVLRTTYTSIADRFIDMREGTGVTNLSIWYPEQDIHDVKPYPWTLYQATGNSATVENVTLVNAYNGFYSAPSELHYVVNSYVTALNTGLEVYVCTDIGRIENVKIDPKFGQIQVCPALLCWRRFQRIREQTVPVFRCIGLTGSTFLSLCFRLQDRYVDRKGTRVYRCTKCAIL